LGNVLLVLGLDLQDGRDELFRGPAYELLLGYSKALEMRMGMLVLPLGLLGWRLLGWGRHD
jgi:hypothetical protein